GRREGPRPVVYVPPRRPRTPDLRSKGSGAAVRAVQDPGLLHPTRAQVGPPPRRAPTLQQRSLPERPARAPGPWRPAQALPALPRLRAEPSSGPRGRFPSAPPFDAAPPPRPEPGRRERP